MARRGLTSISIFSRSPFRRRRSAHGDYGDKACGSHGLGYASFHRAGAGAHGLDDLFPGLPSARESLCGRAVVLRADLRRPAIRVGHGYFFRIARPESHHSNHSRHELISRLRSDNTIEHLNLIGDTTETLATAFALLLNSGYTAVWAQASGSQLTIYSRSMGTDGNAITIAAAELGTTTPDLTITLSGTGTTTIGGTTFVTFSGGVDGNWYTDLEAMPRLNRAVRDWSQSLF